MTRSSFLLSIVACAICATSAADTPSGEHRSSNMSLGRVFLTPAERQALDQMRRNLASSTSAMSTRNTQPTAPEASSDNAVIRRGYIISPSGQPYKWSDGDFQKSTDENIQSALEPNALRILKHPSPTGDANNFPHRVSEPDANAESETERDESE